MLPERLPFENSLRNFYAYIVDRITAGARGGKKCSRALNEPRKRNLYVETR